MITYEWRGTFDSADVNALHAEGFDHRILDDHWWAQVDEHSLGWVCARADARPTVEATSPPTTIDTARASGASPSCR